jgi:hypothetical protein
LGPALFLLGPALLAFSRFARQPLGGQALLQGAPGCLPFGPAGLARSPQGFLSGPALANGRIIDILDGSSRLELLQHGPTSAGSRAQALGELLVLVVPH